MQARAPLYERHGDRAELLRRPPSADQGGDHDHRRGGVTQVIEACGHALGSWTSTPPMSRPEALARRPEKS
jgi:hypothetical protein